MNPHLAMREVDSTHIKAPHDTGMMFENVKLFNASWDMLIMDPASGSLHELDEQHKNVVKAIINREESRYLSNPV